MFNAYLQRSEEALTIVGTEVEVKGQPAMNLTFSGAISGQVVISSKGKLIFINAKTPVMANQLDNLYPILRSETRQLLNQTTTISASDMVLRLEQAGQECILNKVTNHMTGEAIALCNLAILLHAA